MQGLEEGATSLPALQPLQFFCLSQRCQGTSLISLVSFSGLHASLSGVLWDQGEYMLFSPIKKMSVFEQQNRAFVFGDGNLAPGSVCPLVRSYLGKISMLGQHINLWKVNSCKHITSYSVGFARFLTVKNLQRICTPQVCSEPLKTYIFLGNFGLNKTVLGVRLGEGVQQNSEETIGKLLKLNS